MTDIDELKIKLSQIILHLAEIKERQAHVALAWEAEGIATPYAERLRLEHEYASLKREKAVIEAEILVAKTNRPKGTPDYFATLGTSLIRVVSEAGRDDMIEEAKRRMKEEG